MQVTETLSEGLKRAFDVVLPAADIEAQRMSRLAELAKTLTLPGFRPGKVPMPVIKQRFGTAVMAEIVEQSVSEATRKVFEERGLRPAMQPRIDLTDAAAAAKPGNDVAFAVTLEILPEIALPDFAAIALERLKAEVDDAAIAKVLADMAGRQRTLEPVAEARGATPGEVLTVDFIGRIDGVAFPGGTGEDMEIEVAGEGFIPGFTEQIEGLAPGETRTITVRFPEDYGVADLAGKEAAFEITAKTLARALLPEIDAAFAERIGFESLDELRETISQQIGREYAQLSRLNLKRQLLDRLAEQVSFPVPEAMLTAEFDQIWQRIEADRKAGRLAPEDAAKDDETLRAEYRAIAERRVRLGLLLAETGRINGITVSQDEMTRAMRAEAARYRGQEAQIFEMFRKNPNLAETLRGPILEDKVVNFVVELARIEERTVSAEELSKAVEG
jgi:trigger factor